MQLKTDSGFVGRVLWELWGFLLVGQNHHAVCSNITSSSLLVLVTSSQCWGGVTWQLAGERRAATAARLPSGTWCWSHSLCSDRPPGCSGMFAPCMTFSPRFWKNHKRDKLSSSKSKKINFLLRQLTKKQNR